MEPFNPYRAQAGCDLDALIHQKVMEGNLSGRAPNYSTDLSEAKKVLARLKSAFATTVITGQTSLADRSCFARVTGKRGFEVLAETLPLAICRLALLTVEEWRARERAG